MDLQSLTSFTVSTHYGRHSTSFDVWGASHSGRGRPDARLCKGAWFRDRRHSYQVLTGPQLSEPAGFVTSRGAWAADQTRIGTAHRIERGNPLGADQWRVEQEGMPALTGLPAGLSSLLSPLSGTVDSVGRSPGNRRDMA